MRMGSGPLEGQQDREEKATTEGMVKDDIDIT